jgi:hypothetical protein
LRYKEDLAALRKLADELVLTGAWTYSILYPFRTIAEITASSAKDWMAAETHHIEAVRQTDTGPYRHLRPVAREWYARMLLERSADDLVGPRGRF